VLLAALALTACAADADVFSPNAQRALRGVPYAASTTPGQSYCLLKFKFQYSEREKIAELLIDDGCQQELMTAVNKSCQQEALRLGLARLPGRMRISGATGGAWAVKYRAVVVTCEFQDPKTREITSRSDSLSVYVWEEGLEAAQKDLEEKAKAKAAEEETTKAPSEATAVAAIPDVAPATPAKRAADPDEPLRRPAARLSPVKHKFNFLGEAIIGKPGLRKLGLVVDHGKDRVYMLYDNDVDESEVF
jgi:hypothetical protein